MKSLFKRFAIVSVVCGLAFGVGSVALADHGHHGGHGHGGHGHGHNHRNRSFYGGANFGGGGSYYRSGPSWHDTSHYDYHPGGFQRHRNHYHYVPGHYDYHRSGHWHW